MRITILSVFLLTFLFIFSGQTFAANFVVKNIGDGDYGGRCDSRCTLRAAVNAANNSPTDDTISFDPVLTFFRGTIVFLNTELMINNAGTLSINGPGAHVLAIDGSAGTDRIFNVNGATVTIQGVTLSGGNGPGAAVSVRGGGLTLESVVVQNNSGLGAFAFGAISLQGTGGVAMNVVIANSTISGNTDFTGCPAIYADNAVSLNVTNTTVSGNSTTAAGFGAGAVCVWGNSSATFRSTTISGNAGGTGGGGGGGIYIQGTARVDLGNTIVAGNTSPNRGPDLYRFDDGRTNFTSQGGNVIGDNSGNPAAPNATAFPTGNPNQNGDRIGTAGSVINPLLAPLANNGGITPTRALLAGSPAIDTGRNSLATAFGPTTDQRGVVRIQDGDNDGTATVDSGAFELAEIFTVDTIEDNEALSACTTATANDCSLRGAIARANQTLDNDRIGFALPAGINTITLTHGSLEINNEATAGALTITNSTGAGNLLISGNNVSRVFLVQSGANLTLNAVTVTKGNTPGSGGGIFKYPLSTVLLINSAVSGNTAQNGGGIYNDQGAVTLSNSTVSGNVSTGNGGGIFNNFRSTVSLSNSTVSGNTGQNGGGIYNNEGTINLTGATIAYNSAATSGGGIFNAGGTMNLLNTLIAKNTNSAAPDFSGAVASGSTFNLIGDSTGTTGITNSANGNQVGSSAAPIDPKLDSTLALNGGTTQNHALLSGSPTIDKGSATGTDQRNLTRPQDNTAIPNAASGNGADIGAFEMQLAPTAAGVTVSGKVVTQSGRGIRNVVITISDLHGNTRTARTSAFGYFHFTDVQAGETYIISATAKRFTFSQSSQVLTVGEDAGELNFIADSSSGSGF